ncbi:hypothetical protein U9R90_01345 [Streptomyces sp. E11-3]|uniref:hypothetical protein n=1 Tax=Streptomyces sp. E11-3 TaxID=3110112 RepID=UPI003980CC23
MSAVVASLLGVAILAGAVYQARMSHLAHPPRVHPALPAYTPHSPGEVTGHDRP